jgi:PccH Cytochrome c
MLTPLKENPMKRVSITVAVFLVTAMTLSAAAEDVTYRKDIRPLFQKQCSSCHGADAPYLGDFKENKPKFVAKDIGPRMDTYADLIFFIGWPDTGAIMRRLDDGKSTKDGKPGNMFEYLGDDDQQRQKNLSVFKGWVGEDAWMLKRWKVRGDVPAATKEEISRMKLKY